MMNSGSAKDARKRAQQKFADEIHYQGTNMLRVILVIRRCTNDILSSL